MFTEIIAYRDSEASFHYGEQDTYQLHEGVVKDTYFVCYLVSARIYAHKENDMKLKTVPVFEITVIPAGELKIRWIDDSNLLFSAFEEVVEIVKEWKSQGLLKNDIP